MKPAVVNRRWVLAGLTAGAGLAGATALEACTKPGPTVRRQGSALATEIEAAVQRVLELNLAPALSVAVYSRDGVYSNGFGFADINTRERASAETAFYIASSTKSMTALALASLEARGLIDLDTTLAEFSPGALPAVVAPAEVRLRHMLSHVSGISNRPINHRFTDTGQHDPETLWRLLAVSEPNADAPVGKFQYQNIGYNITTILTDRHLRVRWQDLLRREIFEPAGMTRASASMSHAAASGWSLARPHRLDTSGRRARHYLEKTDQTMHSAGGVIMSAQDAVRWLELMVEDGQVGARRCVPADVVRSTRTRLATVDAELDGYRRTHYGLGWYIGPYRNEAMLHHFGGFSGFRAHISYLPAQRIGVAVFVNDSTVGMPVINAVANFIYDRVGNYPDARDRLSAALDRVTARYRQAADEIVAGHAMRKNLRFALTRPLQAYAGLYTNEHFGQMSISVEKQRLQIEYGAPRATAEPGDEQDSVWVELMPGEGSALQFEGDGPAPTALTYEERRYVRFAGR